MSRSGHISDYTLQRLTDSLEPALKDLAALNTGNSLEEDTDDSMLDTDWLEDQGAMVSMPGADGQQGPGPMVSMPYAHGQQGPGPMVSIAGAGLQLHSGALQEPLLPKDVSMEQ